MMNHDMYSSQLDNRSIVPELRGAQNKPAYHSSVYKFKDIENIIQLAYRLPQPFFNSRMIRFEQMYYLVVFYPEQRLIRSRDWIDSMILEYGERAHITVHRLEEYGKIIIDENSLATIKQYFNLIRQVSPIS